MWEQEAGAGGRNCCWFFSDSCVLRPAPASCSFIPHPLVLVPTEGFEPTLSSF